MNDNKVEKGFQFYQSIMKKTLLYHQSQTQLIREIFILEFIHITSTHRAIARDTNDPKIV